MKNRHFRIEDCGIQLAEGNNLNIEAFTRWFAQETGRDPELVLQVFVALLETIYEDFGLHKRVPFGPNTCLILRKWEENSCELEIDAAEEMQVSAIKHHFEKILDPRHNITTERPFAPVKSAR